MSGNDVKALRHKETKENVIFVFNLQSNFMNFLRNLFASILGFFIAVFLLIAVFAGIAVAVNDTPQIVVSEKSVLKIQLDTQIKDYAPNDDNPLAEILGTLDRVTGLNTLLEAIENAKNDEKISGISIETKSLQGGISQLTAIRSALEDFKTSGKFVMAYADAYGQKEYYLSSVADSLFLSPIGQIDFKGLASEILFFKDFQDNYGVKMEVIRHGKYKSAVEPFLENKMSKANRMQIQSLLQSLWATLVQDISLSRGLSLEVLNEIADLSKGRAADMAVENKLADAALYRDAYDEKLKALAQTETLNSLNLMDYIQSRSGRVFNPATERIAVVYAQGDIQYGKGDENYIGQELMVNALEQASSDEKVKAVVLRVNSPGGSALASDLIWRAMELTKAEKPLVVSMGDLAASGGYYIACNADKIVAEPTTITGSIGVFGMLPNVSQLTDKMGIYSEKVATNDPASYSPFHPIDASFYALTKEGVDNIYKTFVGKVAKGRNMTFDEVHEVAQGRVWSGTQALEQGLVDELGGLDRAVALAASLAEVTTYKIKNYPSYEKELSEVFESMPFLNAKEGLLKEWVGDANFSLFQKIHNLRNVEGIQARMPFVLDIN